MGKFDRFMVDVHIGTNRKIRRLTVPERWCHVAGVLPVAAQAPIRGRLLVGQQDATERDYAETAGVSVAIARSAVAKLREIGVIIPDEDNGCEQVHDFEQVNPQPKEDRTNAERQRRYREARNGTRNAVTNGEHNGVSNTPVTEGIRREEKVEDEAKASSRRTSAKDASEEVVGLCRLLASLIVDRDPAMKGKLASNRERWLNDMRLLVERDGRSAADVEKVIRWCQADGFWASNILSPRKLREQFPQLWGQMNRKTSAGPEVEDSAAFLARRGAA